MRQAHLRIMTNTLLGSEYHSFSSVYGPPARGYSKKNDMETFVNISRYSEIGMSLFYSRHLQGKCISKKLKE